jgi:hypothetical protein
LRVEANGFVVVGEIAEVHKRITTHLHSPVWRPDR